MRPGPISALLPNPLDLSSLQLSPRAAQTHTFSPGAERGANSSCLNRISFTCRAKAMQRGSKHDLREISHWDGFSKAPCSFAQEKPARDVLKSIKRGKERARATPAHTVNRGWRPLLGDCHLPLQVLTKREDKARAKRRSWWADLPQTAHIPPITGCTHHTLSCCLLFLTKTTSDTSA